MSELVNELEPFKLRSRRHRKNALRARDDNELGRAAQEFERSRSAIKEALKYLQELGEPDLTDEAAASESEIEIAEQLADCWGILGGIYRAEDKFGEAIAAYDRGYQYESSERFNILNTYNRVNRLVLRILQDPLLLAAQEPSKELSSGEKLNISESLDETATEIERQLREGRSDKPWALADLVMVRVLGSLDGLDIAMNELDQSSVNDPFPYDSMLKVIRDLARREPLLNDRLRPIAERLVQRLPDSMKPDLSEMNKIAV